MKTHYTTYEIAAVTNNTHSNIKSAIDRLIKNGWILSADVKYLEDGIKKYYILSKEDFLKVVFKISPKLAFFLYTSNVTL
ncbi:hypothetical protein B5G52_04145 [Pseudoalteromonas sp. A601]|uniref:hypothetical protein n=1 Tax=Pseudoalteromonas sp. A601 TaxID=1967839 RepID=UPI000B3C48A3|nr:hypothetical protein [Pseudoalteromonas sp. A601]OUS73444.1 hypothetical protein B5G52_04145 [Pseudoalteromonas sp. A601]